MKIREFLREFLDVVPRSFKRTAWAISACCVVAGGVLLVLHASGREAIVDIAPGMGFLLVAAVFASAWVLCLGYVHADARRRAMPPWLWTLVAAFIPNLLGFLLYFACRRPIAQPCSHCGKQIASNQIFCSWCGQPSSAPLASGGLLA